MLKTIAAGPLYTRCITYALLPAIPKSAIFSKNTEEFSEFTPMLHKSRMLQIMQPVVYATLGFTLIAYRLQKKTFKR